MNDTPTERQTSRTASRPPPTPLPQTKGYWPVVVGGICLSLIVAGSVAFFVDSRRQIVASESIEQGLQLLRLEREVGAAWGRVAILNYEHMFFGTEEQPVDNAVDQFRDVLVGTDASLQELVPTPAWRDVRDRLLGVTSEALERLAEAPMGPELQSWGWSVTEDFSGVFPADNEGRWSTLLEATRDAQYLVYSAADYPDVMVTRAWGNGDAVPIDQTIVRRLAATLTYLDELADSDPEDLDPFSDGLDVERATEVDGLIAATLSMLRADEGVQRISGSGEYLAGQNDDSGFSDVREIGPFATAVLDRVDAGAEEVLVRSEAVVGAARHSAVFRGNVAAGVGGLILLIGSALLVGYWRSRASVESTLRRAAEVDPLTGLFNRFALFSRAAPELSRKECGAFAVLQIDLDDFKAINDRYGHAAGDAALQCFARAALHAVEGQHATVARVGGDEFVVLLSRLDSADLVAQRVSELIFEGLKEAVPSKDGEFFVRATSGIACSEDPIHVDQLLEYADAALIEAKESRRSRAAMFGRNTRRNLVREIGNALDQGNIVPAFQPIVRATDQRIVGLEALARWTREDESEVPPDAFVRALNALGDHERWLDQLLESSQAALEQLGDRFEGRIWLNVGSADLLKRGASELPNMIARHEVPYDRIGIEIMERICEADLAPARAALTELQGLGAQIALDDLGSDAIPLRHLTELPLDRVKFDVSLVEKVDRSDPRKRLLEGLLAVAINLDLTVVAEGVETAGEERALLQLGATYLQGFLYSKPLQLDSLVEFFAAHEQRRRLGATA